MISATRRGVPLPCTAALSDASFVEVRSMVSPTAQAHDVGAQPVGATSP